MDKILVSRFSSRHFAREYNRRLDMTYKMSNEGREELRQLCKANGFDTEDISKITAIVEHLSAPIMERYEYELGKAVEMWEQNNPNAQAMTFLANANYMLGKVNTHRTAIFAHMDFSPPMEEYLDPAEQIPGFTQ